MVQVRRHDFDAGQIQQVEQAGRVRAAAVAHQHASAGWNKSRALEVLAKSFKHSPAFLHRMTAEESRQ